MLEVTDKLRCRRNTDKQRCWRTTMNEDDEGGKKEENDNWSESHDTIREVEYNLSPKSGGKPF